MTRWMSFAIQTRQPPTSAALSGLERGTGVAVHARFCGTTQSRCAAMQMHAKAYERIRRAHSWEQLHCPTPIGSRMSTHVPEQVGTPCEAWIHRGIMHVLSRQLEPTMDALEWSTGSSTRYYLLWVRSLHSIEHDVAWAQQTEQRIRADLPADMTTRWHLDKVRNSTPYILGRGLDEPYSAFAAYVDAHLLHSSYDFVSVDGRARSACLRRVWHEQLVAPGGLLLLDNSMRPQYKAARQLFDDSPNWVSVEFNSEDIDQVASTLWCRLR